MKRLQDKVDFLFDLAVHTRNCTSRHESDNTILRVPECLSLRPNWLPPFPLPQASVSPLGTKERQPLLAGEGMRGAISDDLRESLALCVLCGLNRTLLSTYYPLQVYNDLQYLVFTQLLKS